MLGHLHDLHVVLRDPGGAAIATYDPQSFVNWDRSVWQQYIGRANWTQGQSDWGYGVLDGVPYIAIGGWGATSIRAADFDAAFERFRSAPMLILDVRMNGGGGDQLAFDIAGRFARNVGRHRLREIPERPVACRLRTGDQRVLNPRGAVAIHRSRAAADRPAMRQQQREFHRRDATAAERDARRRSHRRLIGKSGHVSPGVRMDLHRLPVDRIHR